MAKLHALVCVGIDYPATPPFIAVMTEVKGRRESHQVQTKVRLIVASYNHVCAYITKL